MNKLFIRTVLLVILSFTPITACGTAAPTAIQPATEQAPTQLPTLPPAEILPTVTETKVAEVTSTSTVAAEGVISYARDIVPIFESRCINCHGGRKTEKGLDLKTYASLMAGSEEGSVLIPGDTENSNLAQLLIKGKMPKRGPKLTPVQLQMVLDWISSGAQNN